MSQYTGSLDEAVCAEKARLVDALPDNIVTTFAATDPTFKQGGFRPGNIGPIRQRLRVMATGQLTDPLRRLLARHSLNHTLVARLSETAISDLRSELAALFGAAHLILAMQLDERATLRETAARWLAADNKFPALAPDAAAARLYEALGAICDACGATATGAPATREAWNDERTRLAAEIRDLRAQLRQHKNDEERARRSREQCDKLTAERDALLLSLKEAQAEARQAQNAAAALRKELAAEIAQREERQRAAVDIALAGEFAGWLNHGRRLEAENAGGKADTSDILTRARNALARQSALDRHSGNRAAITTRLAELRQALAEMRDALANAIVQAPELPLATREVENEIKRLQTLLAIEEPDGELEKTLHARLHSADGNALYAIRTLITRMQEFNALDDRALQRLDQAAARRQAALLAMGEMPEGDDAPEPVLALRRALAGRAAAILLVDGHNLLFALQGRYMPAYGAAVPDRDKRARLIADLVRLVSPHPACRAWIVFDGPTPDESTPAPNVRVTYSGGSGEHRADAVLLDNIRFLRGVESTTPIILASNDNGLCGQARHHGAMTITAADLGALL